MFYNLNNISDESMNILYADGTGDFYLAMIDGLNCDDVELAITPILAVGNFARTDTHCLHMMDSGVFSKLMCMNFCKHISVSMSIRLLIELNFSYFNIAQKSRRWHKTAAFGVERS